MVGRTPGGESLAARAAAAAVGADPPAGRHPSNTARRTIGTTEAKPAWGVHRTTKSKPSSSSRATRTALRVRSSDRAMSSGSNGSRPPRRLRARAGVFRDRHQLLADGDDNRAARFPGRARVPRGPPRGVPGARELLDVEGTAAAFAIQPRPGRVVDVRPEQLRGLRRGQRRQLDPAPVPGAGAALEPDEAAGSSPSGR